MRISDWSSDVCSSDLLGSDAKRLPGARGYDRAFSLADAGADNFEQRPIEGMYDTAAWTENGHPATLPKDYYSSRFVVQKMIDYIEADRASGKPFQIGRASCRERVCQYV